MRGEYWEDHRKEVAGNGHYPLDPKYIDEFIKTKARSGEGWAIAYALLQLSRAVNVVGGQIGGVDGFTGTQQIGDCLAGLYELAKKALNEKGVVK